MDTLHEADQYTFLIICRSVLLKMRNVQDRKCTENQNTRLCSVIFESRAAYETVWKSTVEGGRSHIAIRRMRISHFISKATHTHTHTHTQNISYVIRTLHVLI